METRTCERCGGAMRDGMTNLDDFYAHESCFPAEMDDIYGPGGWRAVEDDGHGGYYVGLVNGRFLGTGIFYTEWD